MFNLTENLEKAISQQLILYGNPLLLKRSKSITVFDQKLIDLGKILEKIMFNMNGVGLAACQIGIMERIFVANAGGKSNQTYCFVNPVITYKSKEMNIDEEGCLSIPGVFARLKRHSHLTITAYDTLQQPFTLHADHFLARIIQHEYDHLEGHLFIQKIIPQDQKRVRRELRELGKQVC